MPNPPPRRLSTPSRRSVLVSFGGAIAGTAIAKAQTTGVVTIKGEITYFQRIALPDDAVAIVELRPAASVDGAPVTAEWRNPMNGKQVPAPFAFEIEDERLSAVAEPVLRAGIQVDGRIAWLSDPIPVVADAGMVDAGTIVVTPVRAPSSASLVGTADLVDTRWRVVELAGKPVAGAAPVTLDFSEPDGFHGRACNSYRGTYTLDGDTITFGNAVATMMACQEPLASQELALFRAFKQARRASIDADDRLVIADDRGAPLLVARRRDAQ